MIIINLFFFVLKQSRERITVITAIHIVVARLVTKPLLLGLIVHIHVHWRGIHRH